MVSIPFFCSGDSWKGMENTFFYKSFDLTCPRDRSLGSTFDAPKTSSLEATEAKGRCAHRHLLQADHSASVVDVAAGNVSICRWILYFLVYTDGAHLWFFYTFTVTEADMNPWKRHVFCWSNLVWDWDAYVSISLCTSLRRFFFQ